MAGLPEAAEQGAVDCGRVVAYCVLAGEEQSRLCAGRHGNRSGQKVIVVPCPHTHTHSGERGPYL